MKSRKKSSPLAKDFVARCYPFLRERLFVAAGWRIRLDRPKADRRGQLMLFEREVA